VWQTVSKSAVQQIVKKCVFACEWSKRSGEYEDGAVLSMKQGVAMTTFIIGECKLFTEISPNVVR
jgi:hypothetical protein